MRSSVYDLVEASVELDITFYLYPVCFFGTGLVKALERYPFLRRHSPGGISGAKSLQVRHNLEKLSQLTFRKGGDSGALSRPSLHHPPGGQLMQRFSDRGAGNTELLRQRRLVQPNAWFQVTGYDPLFELLE